MTTDLCRLVDAVTSHVRHCRHDRADLIDALDAAVDHAMACLHVENDQLCELARRAGRTRLHLIDEGYQLPAETPKNARRDRG